VNLARRPPTPLRAMLMDLDGTVVDSHGLIVQSYNHAIRTHLGREGRYEIWHERVGLPLDEILAATYAYYGAPYTAETLEAVKASYRAYQRANLGSIRAFREIPETIRRVRAHGIRLAIVTTKHHEMALKHLESAALHGAFEVVVAGDDCTYCKPHPEPFLKALSALGVSSLEAVAVGDSQHDMNGARAAGVFTIAACWGAEHRAALLATEPDALGETPSDLLSLLSLESQDAAS